MRTFSAILPQALKSIGLTQRFTSETVLLHWSKIVGDEIASHTRASKMQKGVLTVGAANAVWAHHLMTMKEDIIAKINNFVGEKVISDIKFQAGYFRIDQNEENNSESDTAVINWKQIVLSEAEVSEADNIAKEISNDALRQKITKILRKDLALREAKRKHEWQQCKQCGVLCPPDEVLCTTCTIQHRAKNKDEIRNILLQAPWLSYQDCIRYIECRSTEFNTVKYELIDIIIKEIEYKKADNMRIATLVMLIHKIQPEQITDELIKNTLDEIRGKRNVFTPRR